jgi:hypothetical protein
MKPSITLTVFITCGFFLISGCGDDAGENHASGPPPKGDPIVGEPIQDAKGNSTIAETEGLLGPKDNPSNTKPSLPVEGEEVSVVEGEIASVGTPDDPFVAPKEKEIVELPFPPGTDANASTVNIPEPVVSLLPPLPKGSGYAPLSFASMSKFAYEVDWEQDGIKFDISAFARRVPVTVRQMDGLDAAVEGFMIPTVVNEDNKVTEFLLLPDQMSCCFGKAPEANGWVVVTAPKGVEIMMDRIIRVTGTMAVEEKWDEEFFVGLYHLTCDKITGPAL